MQQSTPQDNSRRRAGNAGSPFSAAAIKASKWRYYRYTLTPRDRSLQLKRTVQVYSPIPDAAALGSGCLDDEVLTREQLTGAGEMFEVLQGSQRVRPLDMVNFLVGLDKNLSAGVEMAKTLKKCARVAKTPYFRGVIGTMCHYTSKEGEKLSRAMALFPEAFEADTVAMIEAGEISGRDAEVRRRLAITAQENLRLATRLKGAMLYPKVLTVALVGVLGMVTFFVIPRLMVGFAGMMRSELPTSTKIVMGVAKLVTHYPAVLALPLSIVVGLYVYRKKIAAHPKVQRLVLRLPVVKDVATTYITVRSLRALAVLLRAVAPLKQVYDITGRVSGNVVFMEYFQRIYLRCKDGASPAEAYNAERHLIGDMGLDLADQMAIGESSGEYPPLLEAMADRLQVELSTKLEALPLVLNFVVLLFFAPVIVLLALSVIEPTLQFATDMVNASRPPGS